MNPGLTKKVLFLGHDASRTGAPLLLLELIKWICDHSTIKATVLFKNGGVIESDYRNIAATLTYGEASLEVNRPIFLKALRKLRLTQIRRPDLAKLYPVEEYPVVYANTIDTCDLAMELVGTGRSLIHHIHELAYTTATFGAMERLKQAVPVTDVYIAASQAVREFLEETIGVPPAKIHVVHEFPIAVGQADGKSGSRQEIQQRLDIPTGAFVVGMCGTPQWRKGTDLFVQLAAQVKGLLGSAQCHFLWLGGDVQSHREALFDVAQMGLENVCHFVPAVANPEAYFKAFDLFALTSREEPFSVAMLEAAASGLPIVCFAGAGGAPELVEEDAGRIVPYLDVQSMAKACVELLLDENRRRIMGEIARAKVQTRYLLDQQGPKFLAIIAAALGKLGEVVQPARQA